jgi:hypothetical protein
VPSGCESWADHSLRKEVVGAGDRLTKAGVVVDDRSSTLIGMMLEFM